MMSTVWGVFGLGHIRFRLRGLNRFKRITNHRQHWLEREHWGKNVSTNINTVSNASSTCILQIITTMRLLHDLLFRDESINASQRDPLDLPFDLLSLPARCSRTSAHQEPFLSITPSSFRPRSARNHAEESQCAQRAMSEGFLLFHQKPISRSEQLSDAEWKRREAVKSRCIPHSLGGDLYMTRYGTRRPRGDVTGREDWREVMEWGYKDVMRWLKGEASELERGGREYQRVKRRGVIEKPTAKSSAKYMPQRGRSNGGFLQTGDTQCKRRARSESPTLLSTVRHASRSPSPCQSGMKPGRPHSVPQRRGFMPHPPNNPARRHTYHRRGLASAPLSRPSPLHHHISAPPNEIFIVDLPPTRDPTPLPRPAPPQRDPKIIALTQPHSGQDNSANMSWNTPRVRFSDYDGTVNDRARDVDQWMRCKVRAERSRILRAY
ncbi:hypothetical protein DFS34DRAFT_611634 [Phlyctochytrium arcticum]|nr:hypothetical protein DFS34DRAFT_611634 [Phlyctochytrium arcticum]